VPFIDNSALEVIERLPGWYGRYFHSPSMTFAHYDFKRGSSIHEHLHPQEEVYEVIEPGGMKTDFFTRSFDTGRHPAYDALVNKVMSVATDPKQMATYSSPDQIVEVVYEAVTDGKDQLRYIAGADAKPMYAMRLQLGDEAFRKAIAQ